MLVLVADDNSEIRSALALVLREVLGPQRSGSDAAGSPGKTLQLVEAENMAEALSEVRRQTVDAVLVDCDLPGLDVPSLLDELWLRSPSCSVIALGLSTGDWERSRDRGEIHFVSKNDPPHRLIELLGRL